MAPIVYQDLLSPPVQAVTLTVRAAGLDSKVQFKTVSLAAGEHLKPEYVKKFPMHAVPALEDDGFYLWDSHAICAYIISAYAKDDKLYPKDPKKKALVDQFLHFSNSILYIRLRDITEPLWKQLTNTIPEEKKERVHEAFKSLDTMLEGKKWLTGDSMTIADICVVCEVNAAEIHPVMAPIVYQDLLSPPVQAVALTVRAAGLDSKVQFQNVSLAAGDHLKPEFVKKFPMHAVPALEDDGFYLWDSHAICAYIISAYAKDDKLYPKDPKKKALVDQFLHFSNSILYTRLRDMSEPMWKGLTKTVPEEKKEKVHEAFKSLDTMLEGKQWLTGDSLTIADICVVCEANAAQNLAGDFSKYKNISAWFKRCQTTIPAFEEIAIAGNNQYKAILAKLMA
ncbi:Glutathione S-transferase 1, isoform D [Frankliniella fusca]|uniref:Glutathione S-transferase 1, isoform D n=2 Tax=Arthropoda TaxID=6656 RepID=A0AAE1HRJ3_9NEOP|nr:Glutathione S-transferase 1, isoform D [Frankliniella fusca]